MPDSNPQLFPNQPDPKKHVQKHKGSQQSRFATPQQSINDVATRMKILEERYIIVRKKTRLSEQNIIDLEKESQKELRLINDDILELKKMIKEVNEKLTLLSDEIQHFTPRTEFNTLKNYVGFWNPMDFVTRDELNAFLRKQFETTSSKKNQQNNNKNNPSNTDSEAPIIND
ncbi:MAG: hypothetical protein ACQESC_00610 [Nanobdellota archaeon]